MNANASVASNMRASSEFSVGSPLELMPSPPRRKGGRKPTFTAEARKQRNRDAQAAFRERRTEYIKELEETVKIYADKIRSLEITRARVADERLMLSYKNSLLERILLHKGVDVKAELHSQLWKPGAVPDGRRIQSQAQDQSASLKRKAKAIDTSQNMSSAQRPMTVQTPQYLSPISNSPEASEPATPASSMALPNPKRAKTYPSQPIPSHNPSTSFRREDTHHRKVFSPVSSSQTPISRPHNQNHHEIPKQKPLLVETEANESVHDVSAMTAFLEANNPYSLGSLDDFDFAVDYLALEPLSFPTLSL